MKIKRAIKKPPSTAMDGGESENLRAGVVFCLNDSINPANCKIDYAKQADVYRQQAEYYLIQAQIAEHMRLVSDLQEQAILFLMPVYAGGTVYQIPGGTYED